MFSTSNISHTASRVNAISFTEIISHTDISKKFALDASDKLVTTAGGRVTTAQARVITVDSPRGFLDRLNRADSHTAFMYGRPVRSGDAFEIRPRVAIHANSPDHVIARTRENFGWPTGAGVFMLDYDPLPGSEPLTPEQVLARIYEVAPALRSAAVVVKPSNSAFLFDTRTGAYIKGLRGTHFYFFVADPRNIPSAGERLFDRLWAQGLGTGVISASGGFLRRSIIDASVWQPERLDFCGEPVCEAPIERRAPAAYLLNENAPPVILETAIPPLSLAEKALVSAHVNAERSRLGVESHEKRSSWAIRRVKSTQSASLSTQVFFDAAEKRVLYADFPLTLASGERVTVGEILAKPHVYNGLTCLDPLEPEYHGSEPVGFLNTCARRPYLRSLAHGGAVYQLRRSLSPATFSKIQSDRGRRSRSQAAAGRASGAVRRELSEDRRARAVELSLLGKRPAQIAKKLGVCERTVYLWLRAQ